MTKLHCDSKGEFFGGSSVVAARAALVAKIEEREATAREFIAKGAAIDAPYSYYVKVGETFDIHENDLYVMVAKATGQDEFQTLMNLLGARNEMRAA